MKRCYSSRTSSQPPRYAHVPLRGWILSPVDQEDSPGAGSSQPASAPALQQSGCKQVHVSQRHCTSRAARGDALVVRTDVTANAIMIAKRLCAVRNDYISTASSRPADQTMFRP